MKHIRMIIRHGVPILLCLCAISGSGCWVILPLATRPCPRYECTVHKVKCRVIYGDVDVHSIPGPNQKGCFHLQPGSTENHPDRGLKVSDIVYCDRNWRVKHVGTPYLLGCAWLRLPHADNQNTSEEYLSLTMESAAEAVYVAYDARAVHAPSWLGSPTYEEVRDTAGNPLHLRITKPDKWGGQKEVTLRYYRHTQEPAAGTRFTFPGNLAGEPAWRPGFPVNESAMYVVIIKPHYDLDCTAPAKQWKVLYQNCGDDCPDLAQVKMEAKAACQELLTDEEFNVACGEPDCPETQICPETGVVSQELGIRIQPFAFPRSSEIEFNPSLFKSEALIEAAGSSFTRDVGGTLHFEYLLDEMGQMLEMHINSIILDVADLNTGIGTFSNIVIASIAPFTAVCDDASPPFASPCDAYEIAQGDFAASVAADVDDGKTLTVAQNANPLSIQIDHVNRTFTFQGGPLTTTLEVSGEEQQVIISLDLTGYFLNFAPIASAIESDQGSACEEGTNESAIYLNAGASFEIYNDPLPAMQANYEWYEDMGQPTERLWGTGEQIIIPPHQLSFGVHDFTLVLTDSNGIADTDAFQVEVFDETPPVLSAPQDIIVFQFPPETGAVSLAIGEAWAWDECADQVMISNDAPASLIFQPGVTIVTWEADDGGGNVTANGQTVAVIPVEGPDSTLPAIGAGIMHLQAAAAKSQETISDCGDAVECPVDLGSLVAPIDQLIEMTHGAAGQDDPGAERYGALLESLEMVRMHLLEATEALAESNAAGEPNPALMMREHALDNLMAARALLDDSAHQAEMLEGEPGLTDGDEPADGNEDEDTGGPAGDEGIDEGTTTSGATWRGGLCGLGAGLILACLPMSAIWKVRRKF